MAHPLSSPNISSFSSEINNFGCIEKYRWKLTINNFYFFFAFIESLKVALINNIAIFMMAAKIATLGLIKTKLFWKSYDVIISVYDISNKILSRDSSYIVHLTCKSSISMREVAITSALSGSLRSGLRSSSVF